MHVYCRRSTEGAVDSDVHASVGLSSSYPPHHSCYGRTHTAAAFLRHGLSVHSPARSYWRSLGIYLLDIVVRWKLPVAVCARPADRKSRRLRRPRLPGRASLEPHCSLVVGRCVKTLLTSTPCMTSRVETCSRSASPSSNYRLTNV